MAFWGIIVVSDSRLASVDSMTGSASPAINVMTSPGVVREPQCNGRINVHFRDPPSLLYLQR